MSAIAKVLIERGIEVSGSDLKRSHAATVLQAMGATISIGHDPAHVGAARAVVVSSAIPESNLELVRARESSIEVLGRGEALARVLGGARSIVVAGTHGKTTTTSMIVTVMHSAGRDITYLVGGGLNDAGTNARSGTDEIAVAESDESDGSFLLLAPDVAVVTNVEADHLDHWGSLDAIRNAFRRFFSRVPNGGAIVIPADDEELAAAAAPAPVRMLTFGDAGDVSATDVALGPRDARFTLLWKGEQASVELQVPGRHNVSNALAAAAACLCVGLGVEEVAKGLSNFRGVERRFEMRGSFDGITIIDDYAHHPTEVRATLAAARPGPWRRVVAVFQPHRFSRTAAFAGAFGAAFGDADHVVVTDVYGAGELPVPGVSGKLVADAVCAQLPGRPVAYLPRRAELVSYLARVARSGDALLTLGAGDVTSVGDELLDHLQGER